MSLDDAPTTDAATADRRPSRAMAALCGVLAGALGLGLAELIAGLVPGAPSPVLSIGALLISLQPPNAKQLVVDLFGTNDKAVLSVAVVIGALVLSAGIGLLARRSLVAGRIAFGALGLFALLAAVLDPLFDPVLAVVTAAVAIAVSAWSLGWLLRLATPRTDQAPRMMDFERRRFLGAAVGVGAAAVTSGLIGRTLLNQRASAAADVPPIPSPQATAAPLPAGAELAVDGITPLVVPNGSFYRIDTSLLIPRPDVAHLVADRRRHGRPPVHPQLRRAAGHAAGRAVRDHRLRQQRGRRRPGRERPVARGAAARRARSGRRAGRAPPRWWAARSTAGPPASRPPGWTSPSARRWSRWP